MKTTIRLPLPVRVILALASAVVASAPLSADQPTVGTDTAEAGTSPTTTGLSPFIAKPAAAAPKTAPAAGAAGKSAFKDTYFVSDYLGTTLASSDADGEIAQIETDAFGAPIQPGAMPQDMRYTGKPYDEDMGAYIFPFRNYRPDEARWMTPDPSGFPDGPNNRRYVSNVLNSMDRLGLVQENSGTLYNDVNYYWSGMDQGTYTSAAWTSGSATNAGFSLSVDAIRDTSAKPPPFGAGLYDLGVIGRANLTMNDDDGNGWLVQQVNISGYYWDAKGNIEVPVDQTIWEAWNYSAKSISNDATAYVSTGIDDWSLGGIHDTTEYWYGELTITASIKSYRNYSVPSSESPDTWQIANQITPPSSEWMFFPHNSTIKTTLSQPDWFDSSSHAINRSFYLEWE